MPKTGIRRLGAMAAATAAPSPDAEQPSGHGLGLLVMWEGVSKSLDTRRWGWSTSEETTEAGGGQDAVFGFSSLSAVFSGGKLADQGVPKAATDPAGGPRSVTDKGSPTRSASTRSPTRGSPSRVLTSLLKSGRSPTSRSPLKSGRSPPSKLKSPRLKSPSRRRARSNRKSRTPVPSEVIERMAKSAPGHSTASPLERGLYIQKVPLLQGLLVADSANEKQIDRKVTSLLVADSPHEKQTDRKISSLLPADVLHEKRNDRKVADPPLAAPREKQTDRRGSAGAGPQAKGSEEFRKFCVPKSQAAESDDLRVGRQNSTATSVLDGDEQVEFSASEAAEHLSEGSDLGAPDLPLGASAVSPTSTTASSPPRRLLSNLPEGSFLRARRMKALAAREDGLAQTSIAESAVHPGHHPEAVVKSASSPSTSPTRGPPSQRIAKPLHRPPEPPRGRGLGPDGGTQRGYTSDPPSDPRLQVEAARTRSEGPARTWRRSGLEVDVGSDCVGSGSAEESPGLSPNCLVWVKSQSPKKAGQAKVLKRARVLVVDRAKSQCKIKPRDGPTQVVGLNTVQRFRLKTVFNPDANEVNEIA